MIIKKGKFCSLEREKNGEHIIVIWEGSLCIAVLKFMTATNVWDTFDRLEYTLSDVYSVHNG